MPELIYQGTSKVPVRRAILHCAATPTGWANGKTAAQVRDVIREWHLARGWNDIGYHYVVLPNGHVAKGRPLQQQGAHCKGHNRDTLGIVMIEARAIDRVGKFGDHFEPAQMQAVQELLHHHGIDRVSGHNDHAATLCPGFVVDPVEWLGKPSDGCWLWQSIGRILGFKPK